MNGILLNRILLFLGFAGIFVAGYLSAAHWMGAELACVVGKGGCGEIAASPYARLGGIPVAVFGMLAYGVLTALALTRSLRGDPDRKLAKVGLILSSLGFLASLGFMAIAFFVVKATCDWCVASAIIMTLTFVFSLMLSKREPLEAHFLGGLTAILAVLSLGSLGFAVMKLTPTVGPKLALTTDDLTPPDPHTFGVKGAPVVIIEFADLTCPHCRDSFAEIKRLLSVENAQFEVVYRHFPLRNMKGHEMSLPAAAMSEVVAEKGKFFEFVDRVFATPTEDLTVAKLLDYAKELGVDPTEAAKRIVDPKDPAFKRMEADIAQADKLAILQTPTFYIGPRHKEVYAAKVGTFPKVMLLPDIRPLWDSKLKK